MARRIRVRSAGRRSVSRTSATSRAASCRPVSPASCTSSGTRARSSTTATRRRPARAGTRTTRSGPRLGDIGYLDDDGYLYLTDRKAFTIISGGVNIYPGRDRGVPGHAPEAVTDVAVFGLPDAEMGEYVHAVVQPADGVDASRRARRGAARPTSDRTSPGSRRPGSSTSRTSSRDSRPASSTSSSCATST